MRNASVLTPAVGFNAAFFWTEDAGSPTIVSDVRAGVPLLSVFGNALGGAEPFVTSRRMGFSVLSAIGAAAADFWWSILCVPSGTLYNGSVAFLTPAGTRLGLRVVDGRWRLALGSAAGTIVSSAPVNPVQLYSGGEAFLIVVHCAFSAAVDVCHAQNFDKGNRTASLVLASRNVSFTIDQAEITRLEVDMVNWHLSEVRLGTTFEDVAFDPMQLTTTTAVTAPSTLGPTTKTAAVTTTTPAPTVTKGTSTAPATSTARTSAAPAVPTAASATVTPTTASVAVPVAPSPAFNALAVGVGVGAGVLLLLAGVGVVLWVMRARSLAAHGIALAAEPAQYGTPPLAVKSQYAMGAMETMPPNVNKQQYVSAPVQVRE